MRDRQCALNHDATETAPIVSGVINKPTTVEFRGDLWRQKTRVTGLSCGVVCVILSLAVLVELRLVTDRQTDTGPWLVPQMHSIAR